MNKDAGEMRILKEVLNETYVGEHIAWQGSTVKIIAVHPSKSRGTYLMRLELDNGDELHTVVGGIEVIDES